MTCLMKWSSGDWGRIAFLAGVVLPSLGLGAQTFRVATYNLESYLATATETRPAKSSEARAKVRESILALRPDILAVQEMGTVEALHELRD